MSDLKPCEKCGGPPGLRATLGYWYECPVCAQVFFDTVLGAEKFWNRTLPKEDKNSE